MSAGVVVGLSIYLIIWGVTGYLVYKALKSERMQGA